LIDKHELPEIREQGSGNREWDPIPRTGQNSGAASLSLLEEAYNRRKPNYYVNKNALNAGAFCLEMVFGVFLHPDPPPE
jgi:hypothetical protein